MTDVYSQVPDWMPVLIGAGQTVEREATADSPMALASKAAMAAVEDTEANGVAAAIDTIAVIRIFSDSSKAWSCQHGRSNNPPQSIAKAIGASPESRIYSAVGGNEPLSLLIEFARDIAKGKRDLVMLAGAEALLNQKQADRQQQMLDWDEAYSESLEERQSAAKLLAPQERANGLMLPMFFYSLIEQARRQAYGTSLDEYQQQMAALLTPLNQQAVENPYTQFTKSYAQEDILDGLPLTHIYNNRMVAKDGVNQGAALILCSAGKARELGINPEKWVFLHGLSQGTELCFIEREDVSTSRMAQKVVDGALSMAGKSVADIQAMDLYSCFPCAVTAITDHLQLPVDGDVPLSLTGGLPYFGGPGNNYTMHGLAEAVTYSRRNRQDYTLVTANGGFLSKHAAGVFSAQVSEVDWRDADTQQSQADLKAKPMAIDPEAGRIVTYVVNYRKDAPVNAMVLAENDKGERFIATTAKGDTDTLAAMLAEDPSGHAITVTPTDIEYQLHFTLA
ncbi:acetyl-CoA acetyltransferase [Maricurvus nonylphenolicus]|uniref:hypothetical protein n=1 Tax=Maricurvus nonylphenolicus TaxID=1008307 RepID=UPI0036F2F52B